MIGSVLNTIELGVKMVTIRLKKMVYIANLLLIPMAMTKVIIIAIMVVLGKSIDVNNKFLPMWLLASSFFITYTMSSLDTSAFTHISSKQNIVS